VAALTERRGWSDDARRAERNRTHRAALTPPLDFGPPARDGVFTLTAEVWRSTTRERPPRPVPPKWRLTRS